MSVTIGTVVLPNPQLGDQLTHETNRAYNRRMSGTVGVYQTSRPFTTTYSWDFHLTRAKLNELLGYIDTNLGLHVTITDYLGTVRTSCMLDMPSRSYDEVDDKLCMVKKITVRFKHVTT